jgi:hypothetical protein
MEKMNKKGVLPILGIIWGIAALAAAVGGLILIARPKPEPTMLASIPIWGWILIIFLMLFLLRRRR